MTDGVERPHRPSVFAAGVFLLAFVAGGLTVREQISSAGGNGGFDHWVNVRAIGPLFTPQDRARANDVEITTGLPVLIPARLGMRLLRGHRGAPRLAAAGVVWAAVLGLLLSVRRNRQALLTLTAAVFFAIIPYVYNSGHGPLMSELCGEVPAGFVFLTAAVMVIRGGRRSAFIGGFLAGLAVAIKLIVALALPGLAGYYLWRIRRGLRGDRTDLLFFGLGLAVCAATVFLLHAMVAWNVADAFRHYRDLFGGSFVQKSSGFAVHRRIDSGHRLHKLARAFGGHAAALTVLSCALPAAAVSVRRPSSVPFLTRLGWVLIAAAFPLFGFWFFVDPFGWQRRVVPGMMLMLAGLCSVAGGCGSPWARRLFWVSLLAVTALRTWSLFG